MTKESFAEIVAREGLRPPRFAVADSADSDSAKPRAHSGNLLPPDCGDDSPFAEKAVCAKNGTDLRRLRDLLKQNPEASVDLHGMTAADAHLDLENFLRTQIANGRRQVEIVHGRGGHSADGKAVLRTKTRKWLAGCDAVLGFITPRENDGAMRVLLRRAEAGR